MYVVMVIFKLKSLKANCSAHGRKSVQLLHKDQKIVKIKISDDGGFTGEGCARDGGSSFLLYFLNEKISNISRKSNFFIRVGRWDVEGWRGEGEGDQLRPSQTFCDPLFLNFLDPLSDMINSALKIQGKWPIV